MARSSTDRSEAAVESIVADLPTDNQLFAGHRDLLARTGSQWRVTVDGEDLPTHTELRRHGDAFAWGYSGSGPAQLALAMLVEATGDRALALVAHQRFKNDVLAELSQDDGWQMRASWVRRWVRDQLSDGTMAATEIEAHRDTLEQG